VAINTARVGHTIYALGHATSCGSCLILFLFYDMRSGRMSLAPRNSNTWCSGGGDGGGVRAGSTAVESSGRPLVCGRQWRLPV